MIIFITIMVVLITSTFLYMQQDMFGKKPTGSRLEKIKRSPNYRNGKFQNLNYTPVLAKGYNYYEVMYDNLIKNKPNHYPKDKIPSIKTDLLNLSLDENVLVWFGHSSYFIQINQKRILVDPVFSGSASPIPNTIKSFEGTDIYSVKDLPEIDYLFISHDHYDHLDYKTLVALKDKINKVICGLGVGSHFEHWGYDPKKIIEKDWYQKIELDKDFIVFIEPARHFSGRGLSRNNTLWASYVLQTSLFKIYLGGDSGYDTHYKEIGEKHGPLDLVILDNGQYDKAWRYIHNLPKDVLKAAVDLKAKRIFPVHSSKFALAAHPWNEPLSEITALNKGGNIPLITPKIGELVYLDMIDQKFENWWETIE
ncbi:L-ascorbate metabolism protein UlaG, beta-lactamase superfamily [Salegentibacter echinorum]|uniref:L-ascorbate metabolism protein UlaG, beta-lactamase superfamily n=2 Tax=Flavobacteriales TaxID=200644 RepID=A0A1M5ID43_SALEC|nr:L-ascorbate metabolism protein UlaG, beta-lactamase superfamily [Salegentibacter echinorum]